MIENIDEKIKNTAINHQIENRKKHKGKFSKFDSEEDYYVGQLGELAFEKVLIKNKFVEGIDYTRWNPEEEYAKWDYEKLYDKWDFKLFGKTIDVKTEQTKCSPDNTWYYGYPILQNPSKKDYVVIALYNNTNDNVYFVGCIEGFKIKRYPIVTENSSGRFKYKTSNYDIPHKDLFSLSKLFQILKDDNNKEI